MKPLLLCKQSRNLEHGGSITLKPEFIKEKPTRTPEAPFVEQRAIAIV